VLVTLREKMKGSKEEFRIVLYWNKDGTCRYEQSLHGISLVDSMRIELKFVPFSSLSLMKDQSKANQKEMHPTTMLPSRTHSKGDL
jgi:hypothetical protein